MAWQADTPATANLAHFLSHFLFLQEQMEWREAAINQVSIK